MCSYSIKENVFDSDFQKESIFIFSFKNLNLKTREKSFFFWLYKIEELFIFANFKMLNLRPKKLKKERKEW